MSVNPPTSSDQLARWKHWQKADRDRRVIGEPQPDDPDGNGYAGPRQPEMGGADSDHPGARVRTFTPGPGNANSANPHPDDPHGSRDRTEETA